MLKIKQAIIVEGKYDKIKLEALVDAVIITTNGFGIYKDREKMDLIRAFAENDGIIILTDSDNAGFQIRNYIKSFISSGKITNIYIPDIIGKEKRKAKPGAENKLGVEGIDVEILKTAFEKSGIFSENTTENKPCIFTRGLLYDDGLIGQANSADARKKLTHEMGLPENLSLNALIEILNSLFTVAEYKAALQKIKEG